MRCSASTICSPATKRNIDHLHRQPALRVFAPRRHASRSIVEVDEIYNLACPASPIHYQHDPVQTTEDVGARRDQHARPRQAAEVQDPAGLDQRGLWRPGRPSADRGLLGQRQPDRPARLLRRGQALRRDAVLRLSPPARACRSRSRASSTPTARACTRQDGRVVSNFIVQALRGEPITHLRRRQPDALLLLCRRPDRRADAADGRARRRSPDRSTSAIPREFTILELAEHGRRDHRVAVEDRPQAAARRRSAPAPARHQQGARRSRLGADREAREGLERTIAYFRTLLAEEVPAG